MVFSTVFRLLTQPMSCFPSLAAGFGLKKMADQSQPGPTYEVIRTQVLCRPVSGTSKQHSSWWSNPTAEGEEKKRDK